MDISTPERRGQILLPFAEREYVDLKRAARILGVTEETVTALYRRGQIEMIDYAPRKRKRVRYQSIVDFCDELRCRYAIKDRRVTLDNPMFRHRDEDILPFPLDDTIGILQAAEPLGFCSAFPVRMMIEEGRFEAYQFGSWTPWRISASSLAEYIEGVKARERLPNSKHLILP